MKRENYKPDIKLTVDFLVGTKIDKRREIREQGSKKNIQYQKVTGTSVVSEAQGKEISKQIKAASYLECSALTTQVTLLIMCNDLSITLYHGFIRAIIIILLPDFIGLKQCF